MIFLLFILFLRGEDEYVLSAYSDRFQIFVEENNTPYNNNSGRILSRVEALTKRQGFKIILNLPKEKLLYYSMGNNRLKFVFNDRNSSNVTERKALEDLEIVASVRGGVINEVILTNLFENNISKTEAIIICSDQMPTHQDAYTVNKLYR